MRIIVTGSSGFIGKHLVCRLLEIGHTVIEIDKTEGHDLTDMRCLHNIESVDIIFHLAARVFVPDSYKYPREFYYDNVVSTLNILDHAKLHGSKVIYQSSYMYGPPQYLPIDEEHPIFAYNPYANSKLISEELCKGYHRDFGLRVAILRPFNVYGPGQNINFLIPQIIKGARDGKITLMDPNPRRDLLYVDDMVDALISLIDYQDSFGVFNVGYGESYSVKEIAEIVIEISGKQVSLNFSEQKRASEVNDLICNNHRLLVETGWYPRTPLKKGLELTFDNYD
jgi:UDP-glucose 4-epimerase